jgi:hypothetical protein
MRQQAHSLADHDHALTGASPDRPQRMPRLLVACRMEVAGMRFFFRTENGEVWQDENGIDLPDPSSIPALARRAAAEWISDSIDGLVNTTATLSVVDASGEEVYRLELNLRERHRPS